MLRDPHILLREGDIPISHLYHHQHPSCLPPLMHYLPVFFYMAIWGAIWRKFSRSHELEWIFKSKLLIAFCRSCAAAADSGHYYEDPWEGGGLEYSPICKPRRGQLRIPAFHELLNQEAPSNLLEPCVDRGCQTPPTPSWLLWASWECAGRA